MYTLYVLFKNRLQNEEKKTTVVRRSAGTTSVRSTSTGRAATVKTGDESAIMLWLVLMVMSAASIGVTLKRRKKSA